MSEAATYKLRKEAFVSDNAGDTVYSINKVCWIAIATYQLWRTALPLVSQSYRKGWSLLIFEYIILVLPLLLGLTVFAEHPLRLNGLLYASIVFCYFMRPKKLLTIVNGSKVASSPPVNGFDPSTRAYDRQFPQHNGALGRKEYQKTISSTAPLPEVTFRKPFVTVWRAHMMLMTIICILAVDFPVFPRSFGKCETWGTSIMDLGVGSFVFALGFITASPFLQNLRERKKSSSLIGSAKRSSGVLVLGLIRVLMIKGTEYPEHVTEYGVHWNFFFTLGLLPFFGTFLEQLWDRLSFRTMALLVTATHQLLLLTTPLQAFAIDSQRSSLLEQNKEGLISFAGYLAIYLFGLDTGVYTLPPDPYYAYRVVEYKAILKPNSGKLISVLFSYATVWWSLFGVLHLMTSPIWAVSRRVANSAYVLWVTAFNVSFLLLYAGVDKLMNEETLHASIETPTIFQALNKNGLLAFLLANLVTGLINLSLQTMYISNPLAISILVMYTALIITATWLLRRYRLKM